MELLTDRMTRGRDQVDQLRTELMQERSARQDLECDKISLERQVRGRAGEPRGQTPGVGGRMPREGPEWKC